MAVITMTANLFNALGELVHAVDIPAFDTGYPPVIVCNARTFVRRGDAQSADYQESFAWVVNGSLTKH